MVSSFKKKSTNSSQTPQNLLLYPPSYPKGNQPKSSTPVPKAKRNRHQIYPPKVHRNQYLRHLLLHLHPAAEHPLLCPLHQLCSLLRQRQGQDLRALISKNLWIPLSALTVCGKILAKCAVKPLYIANTPSVLTVFIRQSMALLYLSPV